MFRQVVFNIAEMVSPFQMQSYAETEYTSIALFAFRNDQRLLVDARLTSISAGHEIMQITELRVANY